MIQTLFLTATLLAAVNAYAQKSDLDAAQKGFSNTSQAGKLFQIRMNSSGNQLHLFVVGNESAGLSINEATVEASIGVGTNKKTFLAEKVKDPKTGAFFYKLKKQANQPLSLKIQSDGRSETFNFPPPDSTPN